MQPNKNILSPAEISQMECQMRLVIDCITVIGELELTVFGGNTGADSTGYGESRHRGLSYVFQL